MMCFDDNIGQSHRLNEWNWKKLSTGGAVRSTYANTGTLGTVPVSCPWRLKGWGSRSPKTSTSLAFQPAGRLVRGVSSQHPYRTLKVFWRACLSDMRCQTEITLAPSRIVRSGWKVHQEGDYCIFIAFFTFPSELLRNNKVSVLFQYVYEC